MFQLYFIGGVFGAGKSTLCQTLSILLPGTHLKASELIGYSPDHGDPTGKSVPEVLRNQERLVAALADRRANLTSVLLDGHFCLINDSYAIERVPVTFFQRIQPSALVLVEASANKVFYRIKRRDGRRLELPLITELLQAERDHSVCVSQALGVPIMNVTDSTLPSQIVTFLRSSY
jgi:adenylate kinase